MRSDDAGESWQEVSGKLPTDFGFVIDVHAYEPETISGGNEWEPPSNGLPQSDCYVNVLRDAGAIAGGS
jgi:hypothetical protein